MGCRDDTGDVVLDDQGDDVTSHADTIRPITFEYRDHRCFVYRDERGWDAKITPPDGIGSDYRTSPFRSRFLGRTMTKVMREVDHDIAFEDKSIAQYEAQFKSPAPPRMHRKEAT